MEEIKQNYKEFEEIVIKEYYHSIDITLELSDDKLKITYSLYGTPDTKGYDFSNPIKGTGETFKEAFEDWKINAGIL